MNPLTVESSAAEMVRMVNKHPFDCAVLITYNTETNVLRNSWHFADLPLDKTDSCKLAYMITSATAEEYKADSNFPEGKNIEFKPRKRVQISPPSQSLLFGIGIAWPTPSKPFCFSIAFNPSEFGLLSGWQHNAEFWMASLFAGPLVFRLSRNLKE